MDKDKRWQEVNYFDTKKLRKKWQYHVLTGLKKAVQGTVYDAEWRDKLGAMFDKYRTGFDCDCMPEKGPVERLVIYLFKYVSSPPISLRRITSYDGQNVTYWYKDHRRGLVQETISAVEFIGRMVRHLPPKGFRMVRYYGIYARPVRDKVHALVADALKALVRKAEQIAQRISFLRKIRGDNKGRDQAENVGGHEESGVCCPHCGHGKMKLLRIWSKKRGFIYDATKEGAVGKDLSRLGHDNVVHDQKDIRISGQPGIEQLAFGFLRSLA